MKKIILTLIAILLMIAIVALSSCKKENETKPTKPTKPVVISHLAFGGMLSSIGYVTINNINKQLGEIYEVKSGDIAKFIDLGDDQTFILYPTNGGEPITTIYQGTTSGAIIIDMGITVANYSGEGDCILTYIVK